MGEEETLDDMVNKITPENMHPETPDDMREWKDLPNDFQIVDQIKSEKPDDVYQEKMEELFKKIETNKFEFTHSAEEIRNLNRRETRYEFEYKGFKGSMNYSNIDKVYFGKVLFIRDLITYEAETKEKLELAFQKMIDLHIKDLKEE